MHFEATSFHLDPIWGKSESLKHVRIEAGHKVDWQQQSKPLSRLRHQKTSTWKIWCGKQTLSNVYWKSRSCLQDAARTAWRFHQKLGWRAERKQIKLSANAVNSTLRAPSGELQALHGWHNLWFNYGSIESIHIYPAQVQTRAEGPDDVIGEIRLLRIPHKPNGDDLRTVQEHPANLDALATVALQNRGKTRGETRRRRRKQPFQTWKLLPSERLTQDLPV